MVLGKKQYSHSIFMWGVLVLLSLWAFASTVGSAEIEPFRSAKPVWPTEKETEMNLFVGFRAPLYVIENDTHPAGSQVVIRLTASTLYRVFLNGTFVGCGPARGPKDYFRVDEWNVTDRVRTGTNWIAVEVAGYNVNSYYLLDQPSFLQAEVMYGDQVAASTAGLGNQFEALILKERIQKVQRFSFQRPFIEVYQLTPDFDQWRGSAKETPSLPGDPVEYSVVASKKLLPRRVSYPRLAMHPPVRNVAEGSMKTGIQPEQLWKDRSLVNISPQLKGYPEDQLAIVVSNELQTIATQDRKEINQSYDWGTAIPLGNQTFSILDFGTNLTGFVGAKVKCSEKTRLYLTWDEILREGDVDWKRLGCVNAILYDLEPGEYSLESFEPYTLRYLKAIVLNGQCEIQSMYLRDYVNPDTEEAFFASSDPQLNRLFEAGRQSYIQNALDVFMDCPSRERAGWLCDSFFTSRVAFDLSSDCRVETNFFENYLLPNRFDYLPDGMLPMCYPSDHNDGVFIPNWAMWFVVELDEYYQRTGDRDMVEALKPKVLQLLDYFKPFVNEDGLLEKLSSWVFVEWSKANDFVQDVNYPSNMLYARVLDVAGRLYGMNELQEQSSKIRETIRKQSFDGKFFVDNAVRKEGKLEITQNHSEVCQYFAFFFDVANPETHAQLWQVLRDDFGPQRKQTKAFPEVHVANSFIGNVLRLEILSRYGQCQQILDESKAYLLYMADRTGTLWENDGDYASCNHGFASHAVHVLYRDVLGIERIDPVKKEIHIRFAKLHLDWCEGRIPLSAGNVDLRWHKENDILYYRLNLPAEYQVKIENQMNIDIVREF